MKYHVRLQTFFQSLKVRYKKAEDFGLHQTCAFIRTACRRAIRQRKGASRRGTPPHAHVKGGLREINYDVRGTRGIIGPRKFRGSRFFNRPVPNIHEIGGVAIGSSIRRQTVIARYPERSYMWSTVKRLQRSDRISKKFRVSLRSKI